MNHLCREGVLQVATGNRHRDEAIASVQRIRPYLNGRPITLVTDNPDLVPPGLFDRIVLHRQSQQGYRDKIFPLLHLPYKRTLFLDTDLELSSSIEDISPSEKPILLLSCSCSMVRLNSPEVPEGFCELNSGVWCFGDPHVTVLWSDTG